MKSLVRYAGIVIVSVGLGCAGQPKQPAAAPSDTSTSSDSADRACQQLLTSLQRGEYVQAESVFSPAMKKALPAKKLEASFVHLRAEVGDLGSWRASGRDRPSNHDRRMFELRHERGTLEARIVFERGGDEVIGLFFSRRPQASAPVSHESTNPEVSARDVEIGSGPITVGATITAPKSDKGPFPAVLLVAGSGPQDRDESIGPNKPFRDLAEGLSARGIVVLRFDKRTWAHPEAYLQAGSANVTNEIIDDAAEALQYLSVQPEVDRHRVFIVGHSLGALVAPDIARRTSSVAGLALLGVPGRPIPEVVLEQLKNAGLPAPQVSQMEQKLKLLAAKQLPPTEDILGAPASYWWDLMDRDEPAAAKKVGKPVLLVRGERDFQTSTADQAIWEKALDGQARAVTLPGLNHLFFRGSGKSTPAEYATPGKVDPRAVDTVASFVLGQER
jgi:pimeloyl-ACP methyl ester carboxylesterase